MSALPAATVPWFTEGPEVARKEHMVRERLEASAGPDGAEVVVPGAGTASAPRIMLRLARPKQWAKNVLVFAAPGAAGLLGTPSVVARAALAFASMCAVASSTYVVNDVADAVADRAHPTKRHRPVASGHVSAGAALAFAAVLMVIGLGSASTLGLPFLAVVLSYVALTVAYSLWLKRVEVVDISVIAACFVLRAIGGGAATGVTLSSWFLILTSAGALFVVAGKRFADLHHAAAAGVATFGARAKYSEAFLRGVWIMCAAVAVMAYCLWALAVPHDVDGIAWSQVSIVPFVMALLRYALVIERGEAGAPEDVFLHDRVLQVTVVAWVAVYAAGVYL